MIDNHSHQLVQKLWNYRNILRDDGLSYGDCVEQLTFCCPSRWLVSGPTNLENSTEGTKMDPLFF
jgi:hypothetical protein